MRSLAIARFRLWTTTRSATPIFAVALLPAIVALLMETIDSWSLIPSEEALMEMRATAALFAWLVHAAAIGTASIAFARTKATGPDSPSAADLMDSAPVWPRERFWGETLGILAATGIVHLCCLPALAMVTALSPLPTGIFGCFEAIIVLIVTLASAAAAWKRMSPQTKWSATRAPRSAALFLILLGLGILSTTRVEVFRDAAYAFFSAPTLRKWQSLIAAVDNPLLLVVLFAALYGIYMLFFYISSTRDRALETSA